jgi:hypothetical protein
MHCAAGVRVSGALRRTAGGATRLSAMAVPRLFAGGCGEAAVVHMKIQCLASRFLERLTSATAVLLGAVFYTTGSTLPLGR